MTRALAAASVPVGVDAIGPGANCAIGDSLPYAGPATFGNGTRAIGSGAVLPAVPERVAIGRPTGRILRALVDRAGGHRVTVRDAGRGPDRVSDPHAPIEEGSAFFQ